MIFSLEYLGEIYHMDSTSMFVFLVRAIGEFFIFMDNNNYTFASLPLEDFKNFDKLMKFCDEFLSKNPRIISKIENGMITSYKEGVTKEEIIRLARKYADSAKL